MNNLTLIVWAAFLVAQNFSFTFVSRARNSASLKRHLVAALLSNGIFYIGQVFTLQSINAALLVGGLSAHIIPATIYAAATCVGSIVAHWWCLKTEKGKAKVGSY